MLHLSETDRALALAPPLQTREIVGIGLPGVQWVKRGPEDFVVREELEFEPEGAGKYLVFSLTKRDVNTHEALAILAGHCRTKPSAFAVAGRKDRRAITTQHVSAPVELAKKLNTFKHGKIQLGQPLPHSQPLRLGQARANHFEICLRGLHAEAEARLGVKLDALEGRFDNYFGAQRFGHGGQTLDAGLEKWGRTRVDRRDVFSLHAVQSALFNLYLAQRCAQGFRGRVLLGDLLLNQGGTVAGLSEDPAADQLAVDHQHSQIGGPVFGSRASPSPPEASVPGRLEAATLARARLSSQDLRRLDRRLGGGRRSTQVAFQGFQAETILPQSDDGPTDETAMRLSFSLPAGAYATVLLREFLEG